MTSVVQSFLWDGIKFLYVSVCFFVVSFWVFFWIPVWAQDQQCMRTMTRAGPERTRGSSYVTKQVKGRIFSVDFFRFKAFGCSAAELLHILESEGAAFPSSQNSIQRHNAPLVSTLHALDLFKGLTEIKKKCQRICIGKSILQVGDKDTKTIQTHWEDRLGLQSEPSGYEWTEAG